MTKKKRKCFRICWMLGHYFEGIEYKETKAPAKKEGESTEYNLFEDISRWLSSDEMYFARKKASL